MSLIKKKWLHRRSSEGMWREDALALNAFFQQFDAFSLTLDFHLSARRWWRGLDCFRLREHRVRQLCENYDEWSIWCWNKFAHGLLVARWGKPSVYSLCEWKLEVVGAAFWPSDGKFSPCRQWRRLYALAHA